MSRVLNLAMSPEEGEAACHKHAVGMSALERLPDGGIRLVVMSVAGAQILRAKLKSKLLKDDVRRIAPREIRRYR